MHLIYEFIDISMILLHYAMNNSIKDLFKKKGSFAEYNTMPTPKF